MSRDVLALNAGSSTLKVSLYRFEGERETQLLAQTLQLKDGDDARLLEQLLPRIVTAGGRPPAAVSHRLVHGGDRFSEPTRVDDVVFEQLEELVDLAPLHLPPALALLKQAREQLRGVPHVACFDTAFHRTLPPVARRFALPHELYAKGIRRYGFHGLSCEYSLSVLKPTPARVVVAHLGSGASLTAIRDGRSVDTSMGLTPSGGIPMGTRPGDLDPGVLLHLLRTGQYSANTLEQLIDHASGLKGLADTSNMAELLTRVDRGDAQAQAAVETFAYGVKKQLGAFVAVLGGLDCLVFTGGIGEHAPRVRQLALAGLEALGIELDATLNARNAPSIGSERSRAQVRIIEANENLVLARAGSAAISTS
jgi:acetate kinase